MEFKPDDLKHAGERLDGMRLLLAEDDEVLQLAARDLLVGVGAKLVMVANGCEALFRLRSGPTPPDFDAVLMDLQMPVMGGLEAAAALRADARFAALPIIAFTTCATAEEKQRCLAVGMTDHIAKPVTPSVLFATLRRFHRLGEAASPEACDPARTQGAAPLPAITGVDTADGLARVAGNRQLYLKMLRAFRSSHASTAEEIGAAIGRGDFDTAGRLAHTLKGLSGHLGAKAAQSAAGAIEDLIRTNAPVWELQAAQANLAAVLAPVLVQPAAEFPTDQPSAAPAMAGAVDPARTVAAVMTVKAMLEGFDAAATGFIEQNATVLQPAFAPSEWAAFVRHARKYAFADALTLLPRATHGPLA